MAGRTWRSQLLTRHYSHLSLTHVVRTTPYTGDWCLPWSSGSQSHETYVNLTSGGTLAVDATRPDSFTSATTSSTPLFSLADRTDDGPYTSINCSSMSWARSGSGTSSFDLVAGPAPSPTGLRMSPSSQQLTSSIYTNSNPPPGLLPAAGSMSPWAERGTWGGVTVQQQHGCGGYNTFTPPPSAPCATSAAPLPSQAIQQIVSVGQQQQQLLQQMQMHPANGNNMGAAPATDEAIVGCPHAGKLQERLQHMLQLQHAQHAVDQARYALLQAREAVEWQQQHERQQQQQQERQQQELMWALESAASPHVSSATNIWCGQARSSGGYTCSSPCLSLPSSLHIRTVFPIVQSLTFASLPLSTNSTGRRPPLAL